MALTFNQVKPATAPQEQAPAPKNDAGMANVSIRVDADCYLLCDGEFMDDIQIVANQITKVKLPVGQHLLEFMDVANPDIKVEKVVDFPNEGKSYLVLIDGLEEAIEEANKIKAKAEAARKAKEEAERKAKEEAERKAEAARKAKEEAERKAIEEAERKAEAARKAKEEAERKAKEAAERKAKAEADARARLDITYTIIVGEVTNVLSATMTLRALLGWGSADVKAKLVDLPVEILSTKKLEEANESLQKLNNGGFVADIFAVNALGEIVNINDVQESSSKTGTKKSTSNSSPNELSVTGAKKVGTLMKDFNKSFPYLGLRLYYPQAKKEGVYTPYRVPEDKTLASVRDKNATDGNITITGRKKIKTLEKEFEKIFGLYAQVCYCPKDCKPGSGYITTGDKDEMTLSAFNEKCQKDGNRLYSYGK